MMNNTNYSVLTKELIARHEHNESLPEKCFCPLCNVHMSKIKRGRPLDAHQDNNAYSSDVIKERCCAVDRMPSLHANLHVDHSGERLLKLNPYPVLDTDPTLENVNYVNSTSKPMHSINNKTKELKTQSNINNIEAIGRHKEHYQFHNESRHWEKNENDLDHNEFVNGDHYNYMAARKYDVHYRQPSVHRQRKILPMVPPKYLIPTNSVQKPVVISSTTNGYMNGQVHKDFSDTPKQKVIVNPVHESSNGSIDESKVTCKVVNNNPKVIIKDSQKIVKETTVLSKEVIKEAKEKQSKYLDNNSQSLIFKTRKGVNAVNGTPVQSVCNWVHDSYESPQEIVSENARQGLKLHVSKSFNKDLDLNFVSEETHKTVFDHLFSDIQNDKHQENVKQHSALRPSLFSNMPPYIRFSSHDIKGESFPLPLQKVLKWKLSSITPIVVRRTVQNSGFKLVRSEHSFIQNASDLSDKTNQSNQNMNSLQNHYGITPPIVDAFCGAASSPNELKMLPHSQSNDWVGTWGKHMKSLCFKTLRDQQKLNHFPGTFQIGRKDRLWKNLHRLMLKYGKEQFGFIPTSYILPQETRLLRQVWEKNDEDKWIVKPPASARGTGIRVISKWNQIPRKVPLVVQRYIDNPYLINDTKFDLRLYILITSINPLRLYLYDNGLVRFASVKYSSDLTTISDRYMHLTNYSINRLSSQYTQNEDADACQGHKWTLRSLWTYMEKERKIDVKKLWDSLADLVVKTVISGESPMGQMCRSNLSNRYNAYELFGIDVLFDEFLKPWILEVNISPSLHSSSPLDLAVKGPLVKDLMNMVGYHVPNKMSPTTHNALLKMLGIKSPLCYDKRLYTFNLSTKEREKQDFFINLESREEYINNILDELMPDDIRHLIEYEDELTQVGSFQKVFPTTNSHKYHQYFDGPRYYNMLFDAWENKYHDKREEGIALLESFCQMKTHLEVSDVEEDQSKTCETLQSTKMEVEKMASNINADHHQAVISHFSMSAAERRHMVYTSITMSDEGDWISDDFPYDDTTSATGHPMVS
ncbi:uncharacterized protein LOC126838099 isoform X2 [Adelges cooleyi]|uniref:uncharacterized protein LOC126838099 isoform X2 n=1 Tax=Adelges cooleyi TaxID=133065 RepID=UPI00217F6D1C|nr:uncharacterized protein LOC126838099 isoform X2 [Adelges cooleyi]